ncbi:MAG: hypothetical protein ACI8QS_002200, partial [Planctomycetota bacterium]
AEVSMSGQFEGALHYRYIYATGELIPEALGGSPNSPLSCGDFVINALLNLDASTRYIDGATINDQREYIDWGNISKETTSDIVSEFVIGYSTLDLDPSLGGPGGSLSIAFYEGYEGPCDVGLGAAVNEVAVFEMSGLPGYDGTGLPRGYFLTIDLRGGSEFVLPEGPFGFGQRYDQVNKPTTSGLVQSFAGSPDGDMFNPDGNGMVTGLDLFQPDAATGLCQGSFVVGFDNNNGLPVGSHYLLLRKVNAEAGNPASAFVRNDAGNQNPSILFAGGVPIIGEDFSLIAVSAGSGELGVFLFGFATAAELALPFGTLLVDITDPGGELLGPAGLGGQHPYTAGFAAVSTTLPIDLNLCGLNLSVQAVQYGSQLQLTNAVDLQLGVY